MTEPDDRQDEPITRTEPEEPPVELPSAPDPDLFRELKETEDRVDDTSGAFVRDDGTGADEFPMRPDPSLESFRAFSAESADSTLELGEDDE